jgi:hypothetical protein
MRKFYTLVDAKKGIHVIQRKGIIVHIDKYDFGFYRSENLDPNIWFVIDIKTGLALNSLSDKDLSLYTTFAKSKHWTESVLDRYIKYTITDQYQKDVDRFNKITNKYVYL